MCIIINMSKKKGVINPSSLGNLILYIDANTTLSGAAHNDPVSTWADLSGNNYDQLSAGGNRPLVQKTSNTSPNGKVLVRFDGVDDFVNSSTPLAWPTVVAGYTIYFYGRFKTSAANTSFWASDSTGRPKLGYQKSVGGAPFVRSEADGTATKDLNTASIISNLMQFLAVVFKTNGTVQAYRAISNGALTALDQNPTYSFTPAGLAGIIIGDAIGGGACTMDLATEIWYNTEHSPATISGIRNYLKNIYGED